MTAARGVVFLHSCPPAVCPHVEWAVSGVLGARVRVAWSAQPAMPGTVRAELSWTGRPGTAGRIASALRAWPMLRFEVTEDASDAGDGERLSHVPGRGIHRSATGQAGDLVVGEHQLRALRASCRTVEDFRHGIDRLLGADWDDELEHYRTAGDGAPVTFLHHVI